MTQTQNDDQDQVEAQDGQTGGQRIGADEEALVEYNAAYFQAAPGLREAFLTMLDGVPEPDDEGALRIAASILGAESPEDLDRPWESDGMKDYFDQRLLVRSIDKRPSDYADGIGIYLGCQCTLVETGEDLFLSTGSASCVLQLVRAHVLEALPLLVIPTPAKKATKNGYWPYHLTVVKGRHGTSARVAATASHQQAERGAAATARRQRMLEHVRAANAAPAAEGAEG